MFNRWRLNEKAPAYPDLPDSLRAQSVELNDLRKVYITHANTAPDVTPYLSLRSKLSQIWLNRWTILLLLVLIRVIISLGDLDDDIGEAKTKALQACSKVEDIGSGMASMPHYLSVGVNELAASGVESAVQGMVKALQLAVTIIENLILFIINMMTSTYVCLTTSLIHGSLATASEVITKFTDASNQAIDTIASGLSNEASSVQDAINDLTQEIEESVFGGLLPEIPTIDFADDIDNLRNLDIDTSGFVSDIDELNNNIPTYEDVKNLTEQAIAVPFDLIRKGINDSFSTFTFDREVFPVAQKQQLTFCSDNENINGFFDDLYETVRVGRTVFIVVIVILAVAAMIPMAWLEIKRWRRQQSHARIVEQNQYDAMDVVYIASRAMTATWGIKIASRFKGKKQILARWCFAYATSLPAIFVLSLAIAGFFSCLCQFIILRTVEQKVPELADQVGDFAEDVVSSLQGVSKQWAQDSNSVIVDFNTKLNEDVLGFVQEGTASVNDTLNTFTSEMQKGIETVFGDTLLADAAEDIVRCLIGLKIEAVQRGLTWLHDQAHVEFPLFSEETFSLGAEESISGDSDLTTFLASPSSVTTDEVTGAVSKVVDTLEKGILIEVFISLGLLLLYIIVVLIGVIRMLIGFATPEKTRGEGGAAPHSNPSSSQQNENPFADPYEGFNEYYDRSSSRVPRGGEEKYVAVVQGGKAKTVMSHERQSSHGALDSAGKF